MYPGQPGQPQDPSQNSQQPVYPDSGRSIGQPATVPVYGQPIQPQVPGQPVSLFPRIARSTARSFGQGQTPQFPGTAAPIPPAAPTVRRSNRSVDRPADKSGTGRPATNSGQPVLPQYPASPAAPVSRPAGISGGACKPSGRCVLTICSPPAKPRVSLIILFSQTPARFPDSSIRSRGQIRPHPVGRLV